MKNQKGITLVALVITIIVLLILAGVSISLVVGNNGVLTQASGAVVTNRAADVKEKVSMALAATETGYYTAWAGNTQVTRELYYDGAAGTPAGSAKFKEELKNAGFDSTKTTGDRSSGTATTDVVLDSMPSSSNLAIVSGGDTYNFKVWVNGSDGKATIDKEIVVNLANGTTTTVTIN